MAEAADSRSPVNGTQLDGDSDQITRHECRADDRLH